MTTSVIKIYSTGTDEVDCHINPKKYRLAKKTGWVSETDRPINREIAEYFHWSATVKMYHVNGLGIEFTKISTF